MSKKRSRKAERASPPQALAAPASPRSPDTRPRIAGAVGRPTYATGIGDVKMALPRPMLYRLLTQFRANVPVMARGVEILAGFVGTPTFKVASKTESDAAKDLNRWAKEVPVGYIGKGLKAWIPDHLGQALLYGYGIGEAAPDAGRTEIERLWSYLSPSFHFKTESNGAIDIVQTGGIGGEVTLDPVTSIHSVHRPQGCAPYGESLFFASPTFCQAVIDIAHAHRATWRRNGIVTFHVNWKPPEDFDDPEGLVAEDIRRGMEFGWNEATKSQAVDGIAKDFFTTGEVSVTAMGADAPVMDVAISLRTMLEEIIVCTGIPPFMFGLTWSTTERMSSVQAALLTTTIDCLRGNVESGLQKVVSLRQRLTGKADSQEFSFVWPDLSLIELEATARAAVMDAQAKLSVQKFWRQAWADGVADQTRYAKETTGEEKVIIAYSEPPSALPEGPPPPVDQQSVALAFAEMAASYPQLSGECEHGHPAVSH